MATHILIADDDRALADAVSWYLEAEGYAVSCAATGDVALQTFHSGHPDALIIDIMMPGLDGFQLCQAVRRESDIPILMLSARDGEADKVRALNLGADDYVVKPFSAMELVARIKALLRRSTRREPDRLRAGALEVIPTQRLAQVHGQPLALTALEFDLLSTLMRRPRVVLTRVQLADLVWGEAFSGDERLVDTHIHHLREKLAEAGVHPCPIATLRGVGYAFRPDQ
jgi:DNA-binding response OmpR family regulator